MARPVMNEDRSNIEIGLIAMSVTHCLAFAWAVSIEADWIDFAWFMAGISIGTVILILRWRRS